MKFLQKGKVNLFLGGSVGSESKGKIGAYIALHDNPEWVACNYSSNAGHVVILDDDRRILVKQIPEGVVNPNTKLIIGPDATINLDILAAEIAEHKLTPERLFVSDRAIIVEESDILWERENLKHIASTFQGIGAAKARKIYRSHDVRFTKHVDWLRPFTCDTTKLIHRALDQQDTILMAGHQGFGLDINHGLEYPYVTSGMTNTSAFMAGLGVPPSKVGEVIGVIRPHPIRVGGFTDENGLLHSSGPLSKDSRELTWSSVMKDCGGPPEHFEQTTVTKRVRRVFSWSNELFSRFVDVCGPTQIAINFVNYLDWSDFQKKGDYAHLSAKTQKFVDMIEQTSKVRVSLVGTGPRNSEVVHVPPSAVMELMDLEVAGAGIGHKQGVV